MSRFIMALLALLSTVCPVFAAAVVEETRAVLQTKLSFVDVGVMDDRARWLEDPTVPRVIREHERVLFRPSQTTDVQFGLTTKRRRANIGTLAHIMCRGVFGRTTDQESLVALGGQGCAFLTDMMINAKGLNKSSHQALSLTLGTGIADMRKGGSGRWSLSVATPDPMKLHMPQDVVMMARFELAF